MLKEVIKDKTGKMRMKIVGVFLTLFVIVILFLAGPARAITLGITDVPDSSNEATEISFLGKVDLHTNDRIPLSNFTINISNGDTCTFSLDGANLTVCTNFGDITLVSSSGQSYNSTAGTYFGYGYGYNSTYDYINQSFGYGYVSVSEYGYDAFSQNIKSGSGSSTAEFIYNITWTTPSISEDTNYTAHLYANANGTTYRTKSPTIIQVVDVPATVVSPGGGSTGTGAAGAVYYPSQEELTLGYTKDLIQGSIIYFDVGSAQHSFKVDSITISSATITISSTPQTKTLFVGEEWKVDVDSNNYYDVLVKLNSITGGSTASFTIKSINEEIVSDAPDSGKTDSGKTDSGKTPQEDSEDSSFSFFKIILLIILIVVIVGVIYFLFNSSKKRKKI